MTRATSVIAVEKFSLRSYSINFGCISQITWEIKQSDGMGAQFRSRCVYMLLSGFDIDTSLEWHYMEAHRERTDGRGWWNNNKRF